VLLLDEATSSVDPETDALIQRIIQTEFADVTLISIAHRLQTVAYYDRILVLDAGRVAEVGEDPKPVIDLSSTPLWRCSTILNRSSEACATRRCVRYLVLIC
jgi:ABC-type multidrug transport system ATPase subunit